ncbi:MAG: replication-relaxation family protein [Myxococcales bacterium]|nr:replication-relaxation family protein [Myxococcales bacterium]
MPTTRDIRILAEVHRFRTVTSEHLAALVFPGVGARTVQERLRRLALAGYLDRRYFVAVRTGRTPLTRLRMPVYVLGSAGHRALFGAARRSEKHAPLATSVEHLSHDLVAVDFLVALEVAAKSGDHDAPVHIESVTEYALRKRSRGAGLRLIPDAAVTLRYGNRTAAFALEVVRAPVRRGNATLTRKLRGYQAAARDGSLGRLLGAPVRAVIVALRTPLREKRLRAAGARSGLIWTVPYERFETAGPPATHFTPETILTLPMTDLAGRTYSLGAPFTPERETPSPLR